MLAAVDVCYFPGPVANQIIDDDDDDEYRKFHHGQRPSPGPSYRSTLLHQTIVSLLVPLFFPFLPYFSLSLSFSKFEPLFPEFIVHPH